MENPYSYEPAQDAPVSPEKKNDEASKVISDTVIGLNTRRSDNLFQAIFILVSILLFAAIGSLIVAFSVRPSMPWYGGAIIGSFAGLLFGFFTSGIILMVYRASRHLRGNRRLTK